MLKEAQLNLLLNKVLNQTGKSRKEGSELVYFCPFCNHPKRKLEISISENRNDFGYFHCWTCNVSGKSFKSLFYKLKAKELYFDELYKIIGEYYNKQNYFDKNNKEKLITLSLPEEFISLCKPTKSFAYGHAMSYLINERGVLMDDIIRYDIGYCEEGQYKQRIIIPSYDKNGNLNFFSARSYYEGNNSYKYILSPWSKDIIGFELFINWSEPVTITEAQLNAITIRNNAIPLFGKILSKSLMLAMVENKVKRVNVCLDTDAENDSIKVCEKLLNLGINTYFVKLEGGKDPNEIGFEKMCKLIDNSQKVDFYSLMKRKVEL